MKYAGCITCGYFKDDTYKFICNICDINHKCFYICQTFKTTIHIKELEFKCNECDIKSCGDYNKTYCYDLCIRDHYKNSLLIIKNEIEG